MITNKFPNHIAIIMDGNGRWAEKRGLNRTFGHLEGAKASVNIIGYCKEVGVKYLTLYAFSMENWQRPKLEINSLMELLKSYLKNDLNQLIENDIRLNIIGDITRLSKELRDILDKSIKKTAKCQTMVLTLALSYSSWFEVGQMVKKIGSLIEEKKYETNKIDEDFLRKNLATKSLPNPDLLIRTGNELRLSNFLLLELSYSELYFVEKLWPDFSLKDMEQAIITFGKRKRRFGSL